eukprot:TRINITY_DN13985_c0_g1_i1.p1 TRINITY_DN13985_c0_g1~~TRINITY_DN13985_c0_g1_i1.p1  ORF type:complete len:532 (+),score=50.93 TRINITY_DN13985_c0_g1_i1:56-1597(+)
MGFVSSVVIGMVVGVLFIYAWKYFMGIRHKKRKLVKEELLMLQTLTKDHLRVICNQSTPKWIQYTEFDEADWMTQMLQELWPHIIKATSTVAKESIEPSLEASKPKSVRSLKFAKFKLGNSRDYSPKVEGVKVHTVGAEADQVIMDMKLFWESDASIILSVATAAVKLQVQVKDLRLVGTLRFILQLGKGIPCIDAVVVSLVRKPRPVIDFTLKASGGNLNSVPGLESMINNIVWGVIESVILWPERIVIPLNPAFDVTKLEMSYEGQLVVTIVKAEGLKNVDTLGKSYPYCKLWLNPKHVAKTTVKDNDLDPVWNETFVLPVDDPHSAELTIKIEDDDLLMDVDLGWALLPVADCYPHTEPLTVTVELLPRLHDPKVLGKDNKRGRLTVTMAYRRFGDEEAKAVTALEKARADPDARDKALSAEEAASAYRAAIDNSRLRKEVESMKSSKRPGMSKAGSMAGSSGVEDALPVSMPAGAPVVDDLKKRPSTPSLTRARGDLKSKVRDGTVTAP